METPGPGASEPAEYHSVRRLLIVEDEADLRGFLVELFNHPLIVTETATNGIEALVKAREFKPHVILLDVWLPGIDGFEVFRVLRREPDLLFSRVIFVSAHAEPGALALAKDNGAYAWIRKPFAGDKLIGKVLEALALPVAVSTQRAEARPAATSPSGADRLPLPPDGPDITPPAPGIHAWPPAVPYIAVITEDPALASALAERCRQLASETAIVCDYRFGMSAIRDLGQHRPDVILIDHDLPDMDGPSALRLIRRNPELADVPVMLLSPGVDPALVAGEVRRALRVV
jgi:CheY-like chemotaxis protein